MDENATILVYHNNSLSPQQPSQDLKSQPKKPKINLAERITRKRRLNGHRNQLPSLSLKRS
jgi:hypothetical protein